MLRLSGAAALDGLPGRLRRQAPKRWRTPVEETKWDWLDLPNPPAFWASFSLERPDAATGNVCATTDSDVPLDEVNLSL